MKNGRRKLNNQKLQKAFFKYNFEAQQAWYILQKEKPRRVILINIRYNIKKAGFLSSIYIIEETSFINSIHATVILIYRINT